MYRILPTLLMALMMNQAVWSQETEPDAAAGEDEAAAETTAETTAETEDEIDVSDIESESYADAEEEDFVPTEDIPADQAIPFPTDI
jgi:hypothetical protein